MILVSTFVAGHPKTKGSLAKRPNGTLYDSVVDSGKWRALMAGALRDAYARTWAQRTCGAEYHASGETIGCTHPHYLKCGTPQPYPAGVEVSALFWLPVDPLASGAGDLDKLLRNVLDALGTRSKNPRYNGGVIIDDNQVVRFLSVHKIGPTDQPGVHVTVDTVD